MFLYFFFSKPNSNRNFHRKIAFFRNSLIFFLFSSNCTKLENKLCFAIRTVRKRFSYWKFSGFFEHRNSSSFLYYVIANRYYCVFFPPPAPSATSEFVVSLPYTVFSTSIFSHFLIPLILFVF